MTRIAAGSSILLAVLLAWATACSDGTGPRNLATRADTLPGLIVSQPISAPAGASMRIRAFASVSASGSVVYVSLVPGTVPTGLVATIRDQASGVSVTTAVVDGGFDPVAIAASVADTLLVDITSSGSAGPLHAVELVRANRPPVVVRTSPPAGGRDVPLNASIVVVFSDPIDSATLNTGSLQLWRGTTPVAGTVRFTDATRIAAELHPAAVLARQTEYGLVATQAIRDVNGFALASPLAVQFTTGASAVTTLAVTGLPSSLFAGAAASFAVVAKDASGSTVAGYTGTVHFTSTDPAAWLPPDYRFLSQDNGTHAFQVSFRTAGLQALIANDVIDSVAGIQTITVAVAAATRLAISDLPGSMAAGVSANVVVTATDAAGNTAVGYTGTVHFTSSDPAALLPLNYAFTAGDFGRHTFESFGGNSYDVSFGTVGVQSLVVTDDSSRTGSLVVTVTPPAAHVAFYVANGGSNAPGASGLPNSITVYSAGAAANASPTATIVGSNTGLNGPQGIARDAAGQLYVANSGNSITVYAAGATGNATPTATIVGSNTGLDHPIGIALDAAGRLYVANPGGNSITVYAAGATGNAIPTATIAGSNTGLNHPIGIALDAAGRLYVANPGGSSITVYAAGASGNAAPAATITITDSTTAITNAGLGDPGGIAVDATGKIYVVVEWPVLDMLEYDVRVYAAGATGNATPIATIERATIPDLNMPVGIAVDAAGRLYVVNSNPGSVTIYAAGANGRVAPVTRITGSNTGLNGPTFIAF